MFILMYESHAKHRDDCLRRPKRSGVQLTAPLPVVGIRVAADPDAELGRRDELVPLVDLLELAAVVQAIEFMKGG